MGSLFTINFEVLSYKGVGRVGLTVEFNFVFAVKADTGTRPHNTELSPPCNQPTS